jgi:HEAT repeat protein
MYGEYLVLCGMVWAQFGAQEAGLELIRALTSSDPDVRVLARTLLEQANGGSKELIGEALAQDEISVSMASLCAFKKDAGAKLWSFSDGARFAAGSA